MADEFSEKVWKELYIAKRPNCSRIYDKLAERREKFAATSRIGGSTEYGNSTGNTD